MSVTSYTVEDAAFILRRLMATLPVPDYGVAEQHQRAGMRAPEWVRLIRCELRAG